ncbi:hypothetical protein FWK35_00039125 [Aphis craccivora]|uniref:Uncharacterized protein n=1 Tax=Aphis craccivora TaxID=307492 RepID=A0A6G0VWB7_APHCR|nr:hypothetical protein FWK35_00039125 [Aphis craccivora]
MRNHNHFSTCLLKKKKKSNASNRKKKKNNEDNDTNKIFSRSMFDSSPTHHNTIKSADILQNEMSSDLPTFGIYITN